MNTKTLIGGFAAIITISGLAIAKETITYQRDGDVAETGASGYKSDKRALAGATKINQALSGVAMWEISDQACNFQVATREIHHDQRTATWGKKIKSCGSNSEGGGKKTVALGSDEYIDGIRICTTTAKESKKTRLKGVEIYGARIAESGAVVSGSSTAKFQRSNCKKWRPKVSCPTGQIAFSITTYRGDKGINGVTLRCQAVKQKKTIVR